MPSSALALNFSHTRGTPKKKVGRTSRRFCGTDSTESAKYTCPPSISGAWSDSTCSAMCDSGR